MKISFCRTLRLVVNKPCYWLKQITRFVSANSRVCLLQVERPYQTFSCHLQSVRLKGSVHDATLRATAATAGANQSETPINSARNLIGSRQRLLQSVAYKVASCREALKATWHYGTFRATVGANHYNIKLSWWGFLLVRANCCCK